MGGEGGEGDREQKWRGEVSGGHSNHWPCHKSLVRQQRSHRTFRFAGFGSPLVQLTNTTLLQLVFKESWCFQRGLDEKMNGERKRGPERILGPEEECIERMSPF